MKRSDKMYLLAIKVAKARAAAELLGLEEEAEELRWAYRHLLERVRGAVEEESSPAAEEVEEGLGEV